ncbi:hypothetical protein [Paeniglutamicibacter terrestris]|uniref:PD-(D/E)XK endonuclease-like domain-containing protein n=1 Tax=Paeniglutamicibacter terrestris TaxID=2723403 RepID=A0ABX1G664_9MICC|nr:hypothetical protein [Paeniglutamicibacter terrestris]NKG21135.1 hypothetical protein [Paeniglutamicibacter terrestris]
MSERSQRVLADSARRRKAGFFQDLGFKPGELSDGEELAVEIESLEATIARVRELHNADGYRTFARNRATGLLPDPDGEAYCTHCQLAAPCPTIEALGGAA